VDKLTSLSGQIISLHDQGYSTKEIVLELRTQPGLGGLSEARVRYVIRKATSRSADSRRLFEIYELVLETLALVKEIASARQKSNVAQRMRGIENTLNERLGAAIDREPIEPSPPGSGV
jgi:hypothetical protein